MLSGEEFTDGGRGYPLLLQSGEAFHGVPNHEQLVAAAAELDVEVEW